MFKILSAWTDSYHKNIYTSRHTAQCCPRVFQNGMNIKQRHSGRFTLVALLDFIVSKKGLWQHNKGEPYKRLLARSCKTAWCWCGLPCGKSHENGKIKKSEYIIYCLWLDFSKRQPLEGPDSSVLASPFIPATINLAKKNDTKRKKMTTEKRAQHKEKSPTEWHEQLQWSPTHGTRWYQLEAPA